MDPGEVVSQHWERMQARDWDGLGELLADDFVVEWPNARLRIRGRENYVGFNRTYPEGWSIELLRIVSAGSTAGRRSGYPIPLSARTTPSRSSRSRTGG